MATALSAAATLLGGFLSTATYAAIPETGLYWSPNEDGKGYYIELQGDTVVVVAYAFRPSGPPLFYIGSGPIRTDTVPPDYDISQPEGILPVHAAYLELFEVSGGACLACEGTGYLPPSQTARINLWWVHSSQPTIELYSDGLHHQPFELQRLNFRLPTVFSTGDPVFRRVPDLVGEWVFTEVTDPQAIPSRFNFTERTEAIGITTYRDPARGAEVRCIIELAKQPGCEFSQASQVLFSASANDVGLSRIQAYRGDLLPRTGTVGRRPEMVIGYRIQR